MSDIDEEWKPNGRPQSTIAQHFSMTLDNAFGLDNTEALTKSVEEKKTRVNDQNAELEALEARLKAMEARLKENKANKAAVAGPSSTKAPTALQNSNRAVNGQCSRPPQMYQNKGFANQQNQRQYGHPTAKQPGVTGQRPIKAQGASDEEEDSEAEIEVDDDDDDEDEDDSNTEDSSEEEEETK